VEWSCFGFGVVVGEDGAFGDDEVVGPEVGRRGDATPPSNARPCGLSDALISDELDQSPESAAVDGPLGRAGMLRVVDV